VDLLVDGKPVVGLNKAGLFHFEHYRKKRVKGEALPVNEEAKELEQEAANLEQDRHKVRSGGGSSSSSSSSSTSSSGRRN